MARKLNKRVFKVTCLFLTFFTLLTSSFSIWHVSNVIEKVPEINEQVFEIKGHSQMFDEEGREVWADTSQRRDFISLKDIPKLYLDMLIETEDSEFYQHHGVNIKGLFNAGFSVVKSIFTKEEPRGGSSIDQQLIKNTFLKKEAQDRTIDRKIKEVWLALKLNERYAKDQILEWYVNLIDLGEHSKGVNTISLTYFGKDFSLFNDRSPETISKLAYLVGLGQAPSLYNLYDNPRQAQERRDIILNIALTKNLITNEEYQSAKSVPIIHGLKDRYWRDVHLKETMTKYSAYIQSALNQVKSLGYDILKTPMKIHTSLNRSNVDWLQEVIDTTPYIQTDDQQIAVTVIDNSSGRIISQVGGRHQNQLMGFNRATSRQRSSGSTLKTFLSYAPLIEFAGLGSNYRFDSSNYIYQNSNEIAYNYGKATYGIVDMKYALRMSLNTPALRAFDLAGQDLIKQTLSLVPSIDVKQNYVPTDALGLNISTEDLSAAYASIGNLGTYHKPNYLTKIEFLDGSIKEIKPQSQAALTPSTSYILLKMLEGTTRGMSADGSGIPEFSGHAVKTGTVGYSDELNVPDRAATDVWVVGTTKSITVAIWSGYDEPYQEGHYVLDNDRLRKDTYKSIMRYFSQNTDTSAWQKPEGVLVSRNDYLPISKRESSPAVEVIEAESPVQHINNSQIVKTYDLQILEKQLKEIENWKDHAKEFEKYQLRSKLYDNR